MHITQDLETQNIISTNISAGFFVKTDKLTLKFIYK